MVMAKTEQYINIIPKLVKRAEKTGRGLIIDGATNLRSLTEVSQDSEPKLPTQYQDCIDEGGIVAIDWRGKLSVHPNNNDANGAKK